MTTLADLLYGEGPVARVRLSRVRGSSPRAEGTEMFVSPTALHGTIGGGQLEYMAIDEARKLLASGGETAAMDLPLGPEIGQCCGGRVEITLTRMNGADRAAALRRAAVSAAEQPRVLIFGAGHVGRALAAALLPLPLNATLIDSRAEELALAAPGTDARLTPLPEAELRDAPPGAAYVILTHDHSLDFLLAAEALSRGDAAYVGMIGSATKRQSFTSFARRHAPQADLAPLTCPIGAHGPQDKRPEVIAALTVAELLAALLPVRAKLPA